MKYSHTSLRMAITRRQNSIADKNAKAKKPSGMLVGMLIRTIIMENSMAIHPSAFIAALFITANTR